MFHGHLHDRFLSCYAPPTKFRTLSHVILLVNKDIYYKLGDFNEDDGTLASIIRKSWCSALGISYPEMKHLVDISRFNPIYLNLNSPLSSDQLSNLNQLISYISKEATKQYGQDQRSFGCSR
ncbi:YagK/YfjJ domain-containing protein [Castellaniella sp.]|uniref:YagK/YfjJ domain-containing protein n=1 Tax=Castellaniella sp. TaxID=1955812 RepID=UPI003A8DC8EC